MLFVLTLVSLLTAPSAFGQLRGRVYIINENPWDPRGQVGVWQDSMSDFINGSLGLPPGFGNPAYGGGYYGYGRGYGYPRGYPQPGYGRPCQPVSKGKRVARVLGAAAVGALGGFGATGTARGTGRGVAWGGAFGVGAEVIDGYIDNCDPSLPVYGQPRVYPRQPQPAPQPPTQAQAHPEPKPGIVRDEAGNLVQVTKFTNATDYPIEVFVGGRKVFALLPTEYEFVETLVGERNFRAEALIVANSKDREDPSLIDKREPLVPERVGDNAFEIKFVRFAGEKKGE